MSEYTDKIREIAERLIKEGQVDMVIGFQKGSVPMMNEPCWVRRPEEAAKLVWDSNCVINLATDKDKVFREAYRVLKPGGRLAVSDMVTKAKMPEYMRKNMDSWASCVSGAIPAEEYMGKLRAAGFKDVNMVSRRGKGFVYSAEIEAHKPQ